MCQVFYCLAFGSANDKHILILYTITGPYNQFPRRIREAGSDVFPNYETVANLQSDNDQCQTSLQA